MGVGTTFCADIIFIPAIQNEWMCLNWFPFNLSSFFRETRYSSLDCAKNGRGFTQSGHGHKNFCTRFTRHWILGPPNLQYIPTPVEALGVGCPKVFDCDCQRDTGKCKRFCPSYMSRFEKGPTLCINFSENLSLIAHNFWTVTAMSFRLGANILQSLINTHRKLCAPPTSGMGVATSRVDRVRNRPFYASIQAFSALDRSLARL